MTERLNGVHLDAVWDFNDPIGSEKRLRALAGSLTSGSIAAAEVETQIARSLGLQHRFDDGHRVLDGIVVSSHQVETRVLLERGRLFNSAGNSTSAMPLFSKAVSEALLADDDYLRVDALHMLAIVDVNRTEQWTADGLAVVQASSDTRVQGWAGALHNNLGWARHDAGQYVLALDSFEAAVSAHSLHGSPMQIHIAHWTVARCLRSLGRAADALAIQHRLRANDPPDSYVDEEIAILESSTE